MQSSSPQSQTCIKHKDMESEAFSARLEARLCVIFIALTQVGLRFLVVFAQPGLSQTSKVSYMASVPFLLTITGIVAVEYAFYKKKGAKIAKYSRIVDALFFIIFTAEWMFTLLGALTKVSDTDPPSYSVTAIFGFTAFSWRTLLQSIITQHWQLKVIPPTAALGLTMGYVVYYDPSQTFFTLVRGILQVLYTIVLFYFEDRIKLRMLLTNVQQEKWMKINEFILNNIPENIMIFDRSGETKFINDYCRSFLEKYQATENNIQKFFALIKDIHQQQSDPESQNVSASRLLMERMTTTGPILDQPESVKIPIPPLHLYKIQTLEDLILNFNNLIKEKSLQERSFLIYNAKLHQPHFQEKSIEIKISFIQQHGKDYIILILRDTTQRDLLVTLEDNNKYKDHLLASVSHELRAPLNGNINLVETAILSKDVPQTVKETLLTPALRSSKFLLNLINDILDMSQIKAQKLRLVFQSANLFDTLASTMQLVELQAKKKGVEMKLTIEPGTPQNLCTDHVRLSQIVLNLLNNALKFTQKGIIKLTAAPVEKSRWIKITVQDSGIGMTQEDVQKLFSSYTHIEFKGRETINPTGVGLGLNIAYNLVELLGPKYNNKIDVESAPHQGSTFSFIIENKEVGLRLQERDGQETQAQEDSMLIPDEYHVTVMPKLSTKKQSCLSLNNSTKPPGVQEAVKSPSPKCNCPKILIVDDNPFNIVAFETVLGSLNLKCDYAYNGNSAIEKIVNRLRYSCCEHCRPFRIVFMDQEMPGKSGSETVKEIKELQAQNLVPAIDIFGCTAHESKEEMQRFMDAGIIDYIPKPISISLVQKVLQRYNEL